MTTFKMSASQAQTISRYKNLRTKVAKCCANILTMSQQKSEPKICTCKNLKHITRLPHYCQENTGDPYKRRG
jgi:hypothetical protein